MFVERRKQVASALLLMRKMLLQGSSTRNTDSLNFPALRVGFFLRWAREALFGESK
jgi:hypothetical protein